MVCALCEHPKSVHNDSGPLCSACLVLGNENPRHKYREAGYGYPPTPVFVIPGGHPGVPDFEGSVPMIYSRGRPSSPSGALQKAERKNKELEQMILA